MAVIYPGLGASLVSSRFMRPKLSWELTHDHSETVERVRLVKITALGIVTGVFRLCCRCLDLELSLAVLVAVPY